MKTKAQVAQSEADKALRKYIKLAATRRGFSTAVCEELAKLTRPRQKWHRQEVEAWLHPDAAKRIEPRLGAGLLLLRAAAIAAARKEPQ